MHVVSVCARMSLNVSLTELLWLYRLLGKREEPFLLPPTSSKLGNLREGWTRSPSSNSDFQQRSGNVSSSQCHQEKSLLIYGVLRVQGVKVMNYLHPVWGLHIHSANKQAEKHQTIQIQSVQSSRRNIFLSWDWYKHLNEQITQSLTESWVPGTSESGGHVSKLKHSFCEHSFLHCWTSSFSAGLVICCSACLK